MPQNKHNLFSPVIKTKKRALFEKKKEKKKSCVGLYLDMQHLRVLNNKKELGGYTTVKLLSKSYLQSCLCFLFE